MSSVTRRLAVPPTTAASTPDISTPTPTRRPYCRERGAADSAGRVRSYRAALRLSQTDLTLATAIPQPALSYIESGRKRVGPDRAARIAEALGVEVEELFPGLAVADGSASSDTQTEQETGA